MVNSIGTLLWLIGTVTLFILAYNDFIRNKEKLEYQKSYENGIGFVYIKIVVERCKAKDITDVVLSNNNKAFREGAMFLLRRLALEPLER